MKLYSENKEYKLYNGNMLDMLQEIEENSIDSIVCDPPYELNFMNKGWDNSGIAFNPETWKQCYEVLKPGGYLLAFGGSRTYHRIACAIEDAGFEIRDTIMWLYGSGFPKSMALDKAIDKKGGNDYSDEFAKDLKEAREKRNLTMKYCDDKYCNGSTNWSWYEGRKDGCRVPDYKTYLEIIKEFPELEKYKELIKEAEREVVGKNKNLNKGNGGFQNECGYVGGKVSKCNDDITIPSTGLAKQWQGWGTALKPSFEPIIVARKPFKGSCVDNVIKYGVGGINIDECRVDYNGEIPNIGGRAKHTRGDGYGFKALEENCVANTDGRFPANTILTYDETDFEEVCGGFPYNKGGGKVKEKGIYGICFEDKRDSKPMADGYDDSGSASRYFYCAKASKKDRDEGLDELEDAKGGSYQFRQDGSLDGGIPIRKNTHPTVKPTNLMQYLVRLVTPNGGTVLDPFNGSGSTGKAVMYENKERNKNYKYIGIELTEEYLPIAKARIEYVCNLSKEEKQLSFEDILTQED